jgi:hypothetical protein
VLWRYVTTTPFKGRKARTLKSLEQTKKYADGLLNQIRAAEDDLGRPVSDLALRDFFEVGGQDAYEGLVEYIRVLSLRSHHLLLEQRTKGTPPKTLGRRLLIGDLAFVFEEAGGRLTRSRDPSAAPS